MASQPPAPRRRKRRRPSTLPYPPQAVWRSNTLEDEDEDPMPDEGYASADILAALAASERRTVGQMQKMERGFHEALRQTTERFEQTYISAATVRERWQADTATMERYGEQLSRLQDDYGRIAAVLPRLATAESVERAVREAFDVYGRTHPTLSHVTEMIEREVKDKTKGLLTEDKATEIINNAFKVRWDSTRTLVTWIIGILAFLTITGIIHPLALFAGK